MGAVVCPAASLTFSSKVGQNLSGKVIPSLAGVIIIADVEGGGEAVRTVTDAEGQYSIGYEILWTCTHYLIYHTREETLVLTV